MPRARSSHLLAHVTVALAALITPAIASAQTVSLESLADPEAKIVAHLDIARLRAAPSYRQIENVLAETLGDSGIADDHARDVLERVDECVVSARIEDLEAEQVLLLARGRFTLDDTTRLIGTPGVTIEARRNHRIMRRAQKAAVFVGTDRFVFGNAQLVYAALDRIDGTARRAPAQNATIARLLAEPTRAAHMLSVVGVVEGELRTLLTSELGTSSVARATAFVVAMDLTSQLALDVGIELPDAAAATQSSGEFSALLAEGARAPIVRTMGLTGVVRALRARAAGVRMSITARLRDADVRRLVTLLGAELGPAPETRTASGTSATGR